MKSRFVLYARALFRTAGAEALERAIPLFGGILLASLILFAGHGIDARDVTRFADRSLGARALLWAAWIGASAPFVRVLFAARSARFLRSLPVPRSFATLPLALATLLLQAPWALLWIRGAGIVAGLTAGMIAASLGAIAAPKPIRRIEIALFAVMVAAALAPGVSTRAPWLVLPLATLVLGRATAIAWARARDEGRHRFALVRGPRTIALLLSNAARLVRVDLALLVRALFIAAAGGGIAALGARNNDALTPQSFASYAVVAAAIPLVIAAGSAAGSIDRAASGLTRILRAAAVPKRVEVVARFGAASLAGAIFGATSAASAFATGIVEPAAAGRAVIELLVAGASLGALASFVIAWAVATSAPKRRDPGGAIVVGLVVLAAIATILAATIEERAPFVLLGLALAALTRAARDRRVRLGNVDEPNTSSIVAAREIRKWYGGRAILDGVSFDFEGPGVLVVEGENGAGKSTLLSILAGVIDADGGQVLLGGEPLAVRREKALANVGWVPDAIDLPDHLTVMELVHLVASLRGVERPAESTAERLGVRALLGERLRALSLGQRRRAGLLAALAGEPRLLVLDEPTNGLDQEGLSMLADLLRERTTSGRSAIVATHDRAFGASIASARLLLATGKAALSG